MTRLSSPRVRRAPLFGALGGALLIVGMAPVWAQNISPASQTPAIPPAPTSAFTSPINAGVQAVGPNFKLQPGDVLSVQVANHPDMSAQAVAVAANGKLNLPVVGTLTAEGKTLGEVSSQITRAYATQLKRPQVSVTLVSSVARQLIVRGAVSRPGPIDVRNDLRLSEVIANVGGLSSDGAALTGDEVTATLVRPGGVTKTLDLDAAFSEPQSAANMVLRAGDIVNISARPQVQVALAGTGVTPSVVKIRLSRLQSQVRVSDVLKSGGSLRGTPEQTKGSLVHQGKQVELNVPALFDGSDPKADLLVRNGDLLTFNTIEVKKINVSVVSLDGSVAKPGNYTFDNDASALRTLVEAGSFTEKVKPDQVSVSVNRNGQIIPVNVERAALNPQFDIPLQNQDIVYAAFNPAPKVQLLGSVAKPDTYRLKEGAHLLEALNAAGGLTLTPQQSSIRILRTQENGQQTLLTADATRLYAMSDLTQNATLKDGDVVSVSDTRHGGIASIAGEVTNPGSYELGTGEGLAELLLKAGGTKQTAALTKVTITSRNGTQRMIDASALANGNKADIPLQEGDFVSVGTNPASVTVMGAVNKPDIYSIPENGTLTLGRAVLLAGGPIANAKLKQVVVVHRLANNKTETQVVDINNLRNGVLNIDYPLRDGDVVFIPDGRKPQSALSQLSSVLGVATLITRF